VVVRDALIAARRSAKRTRTIERHIDRSCSATLTERRCRSAAR